MTNRRALTIHFTDGSRTSFEFDKQSAKLNIATKIDEMLQKQYLLIEADGAALLFPFNNIKYIQQYPAPESLPDYTIKGATISVN